MNLQQYASFVWGGRSMNMQEYVKLVQRMRFKQQHYFRNRDRAILNECRDLERRVDEATATILYPPTPGLFEEPVK